MNLIENMSTKIRLLTYNRRAVREEKKLRKRYHDYQGETGQDCGHYKFIWGVKSPDELSHEPASLYTMNDIDLVYSRAQKRYILDMETAYWFESKKQEFEYLTSLLEKFTQYMKENNIPTNEPYRMWMANPSLLLEGETIQEVYTNFKIFVEGYKTVHADSIGGEDK